MRDLFASLSPSELRTGCPSPIYSIRSYHAPGITGTTARQEPRPTPAMPAGPPTPVWLGSGLYRTVLPRSLMVVRGVD